MPGAEKAQSVMQKIADTLSPISGTRTDWRQTPAQDMPVSSTGQRMSYSGYSAIDIHEQRKIQEMRRENKLRAMKEQQYDETTLHQLFRLFDRDNDHRLSVTDFQTGLVALGYPEAKDMTLVDRIVMEIDMDRSGDITEAEFVAYFKKRRLEDLELQLNEASKESTISTVRVTEYGVLTSDYLDSGVLRLHSEAETKLFKGLVRQSPVAVKAWSMVPRRWFHLNGFQQTTMSLFGQHFGLHEETMKDAGLFQRQKIEVLTPGAAARWGNGDDVDGSEIDTEDDHEAPSTFMSSLTTAHVNRDDSVVGSESTDIDITPVPCVNRTTSVPNRTQLKGEPRQMNLNRQYRNRHHCIIVIHSLSVYPPLSTCVWNDDGSLRPAPNPTLRKEQHSIFVFNDTAMLSVVKDYSEPEDDVDCEIRERIRRGDADLRINSSSCKYLAFSNIEVIMERNYRIHDELRRWLAKLESDIRELPQSSHTFHLYELGKLATSYDAELNAFADCLGEVIGPAEAATPLALFFRNEHIFFKDLSDEIKTISAEVEKLYPFLLFLCNLILKFTLNISGQ